MTLARRLLMTAGMRAPAYVTHVTGSGDHYGDVAVPLTGLSLKSGDLLVVLVKSDGGGEGGDGSPNCTGLTRANYEDLPNAHYLGYTTVGASPPSSVTVTNIGDNWVYVALRFRACVWQGYSFASGSSGMPNPGSLVISNARSLVLIMGDLDDDVVTSTPPSGFTEIVDMTHGSSGAGGSLFVALKTAGATGSVNPAAWSGSGSDDWKAFTIELAPG